MKASTSCALGLVAVTFGAATQGLPGDGRQAVLYAAQNPQSAPASSTAAITAGSTNAGVAPGTLGRFLAEYEQSLQNLVS